jgi:hypothetical protein
MVLYLKLVQNFSYVPYEKDYIKLAHTFASVIDAAAAQLGDEGVKDHLKFQIDIYK